MNDMRKFIFSFLISLMIMPSLACAMPVCADNKEVFQSATQPCAGHHSNETADQGVQDNQVNLLLDCMGVDLQKSDTSSIDKPDLNIDLVFYAPYSEIVASLTVLSSADTIRGPPDRANLLPKTLPIFMTTQRFRI